jgi:hypothetical protein
MKFFSPEGSTCSPNDAKDFSQTLQDAFPPSGDPDISKLHDLGTLAISFEGDKRQVGFFHRYDISCSTSLGSSPGGGSGLMFKGGLKDPPASPCDKCAKAFSDLIDSENKCGKCFTGSTAFAKFLTSPVAQSLRFSRGVVKLDWVRIGLLGGVILLFFLLIFVLVKGRSSNY